MNELIDTIQREICSLRDELGEINWFGQKQDNLVAENRRLHKSMDPLCSSPDEPLLRQEKAVLTITVDFVKVDYFIDLLKRYPNMRGAEMRNYLDGWLRSFRDCVGDDAYERRAVLVNSLAESLQAQAQRVVAR